MAISSKTFDSMSDNENIDTHEQARGSIIIQASLDLKLGKYNFKNGGKPFPLHSPTCKHVVLCPRVSNRITGFFH